jgi:hypothetical protein
MTAYEKVLQRIALDGGCLLWTGAKSDKGYGQVWWNGKKLATHRVTYEHHRGPIPAGMVIDHLCRRPACLRIDHLELVTNGENIHRGYLAKGQTHCKRGHDLAVTARITKDGRRDCRECAKERRRGHSDEQRARRREYQARWARERRSAA